MKQYHCVWETKTSRGVDRSVSNLDLGELESMNVLMCRLSCGMILSDAAGTVGDIVDPDGTTRSSTGWRDKAFKALICVVSV